MKTDSLIADRDQSDGSDARVLELERIAQGWIGTPFVAHGCVRGAGVDCVHLVWAIFEEAGMLGRIEWPSYSMDGGRHNEISQLILWLESSGRFERVWPSRPGDVLCFRMGRSAHHAGLKLGGPRFIHCMFRREVSIGDLADPTYARILAGAYRLRGGS